MRVSTFVKASIPLVGVLAWIGLPGVALAHAAYVRSDPPDVCGPLAEPRLPASDPRCESGRVLAEPPAVVRINFSEPVQLLGRGIRVVSPSGKPATTAPATISGPEAAVTIDATEEGTYVVDWQVTSEDTHPAVGRFAFSVGHTSPAALGGASEIGQVAPIGLAFQTLAHWLHFAGYALGFGSLALAVLGRVPPVSRLVNAGIILLLLAEPVALLGQTGSLGLDQMVDQDVMGDALASSFGRLLAFRLAIALLLWVISGNLTSRLGTAAAIALGVALAFIDGLSQHAASFPTLWLGLTIHAAHLAAMALWIGGLALMLAESSPKALAQGRVRALSWITFALVAVTGLAMALTHISAPGQLLQTAYGQVLAGKQLLVLLAAGLGLLAWRIGLRQVELGALTLLLGVAGLLVALPPPR